MLPNAEHFSADDLMAPLPEEPRLGGPGPFVINLSTSATPMTVPADPNPGSGARFYRIRRHEDERVRFRLRLGPYVSEDEAIAALGTTRLNYPAALIATADALDLRAIAALRKRDTPHARPLPPRRPARVSLPRGVASKKERASVPGGSVHSQPASAVAVNKIASASAWYAVELCRAEQPFSARTVPALEAFRLYRLYSVAGLVQGRALFALRLGFFSDQSVAAALSRELRAHYATATAIGVSVAERERFAIQSTLAPAPVAPPPHLR